LLIGLRDGLKWPIAPLVGLKSRIALRGGLKWPIALPVESKWHTGLRVVFRFKFWLLLMLFDRYRWILLLHVLLLPPIGYSVRFAATVPEWFRNIWGNVAYEMLWIFVVLSLFPKLLPRGVALGVCLVTFGLEFLQLSNHPVLVMARSTLPGRLVLGNGFTWEDFPLYVLGSAIGWWWASRVRLWCGR
jgi:Protein of unknown function (DUF2809)